MNLNKIELPLELWVMVGEVGGPEVWRILTLAIPNMGRYSLNENVQIRMKTMFLTKSIEMEKGVGGNIYQITSYKLPNGELHNTNEEPACTSHLLATIGEHFGELHNEESACTGVGEHLILNSKRWYRNGKLHRENKSAWVEYHENGNKIKEEWYKDDKSHREDGPAWIYYYENGNKWIEWWWKDDKRHREDGPAFIQYYKNGNKKEEQWWKDDKKHRENDPAIIQYYVNGNKQLEQWYKDDKKHREDGPAWIYYYENGNKIVEKWYKDDKIYRIDGV